MGFAEQYKKKVVSPQQAASIVNSNMLIEYAPWTSTPVKFDAALAERAGEPGLEHVTIRIVSSYRDIQTYKTDVTGSTFNYGAWFFSGRDRKMAVTPPYGAFYICNYHEVPHYGSQEQFKSRWPDVFVVQVHPMDKHGFFNFGPSNSHNKTYAEHAKVVIAEINPNIPYCYGGFAEGLTLDEIDYIIEGEPDPLLVIPPPAAPIESERKIAEQIVSRIDNGACVQLGIGSMPNTIGTLLAESDLKDLGVHSEMFCEGFMAMHKAGKITNRYKPAEKYKSAYTFAMGSQELFDYMDRNPLLGSCPVDYLNDPTRIRENPKMVSINNIVEVDLFTQVVSETAGTRQISGSGGQLDFALGSYESEGGQSFLAFNSTYKDKEGNLRSRVRPTLTPGSAVTAPRTVVHWLVTEYGMVNVKGMSNWERAEAVISIAHPDFREELIKEAEKMGIWHPSNKIR